MTTSPRRLPVVVTGASGFIGRALVAHLRALGWPVIAVSRRAFDPPPGVRMVRWQGDPEREAATLEPVLHSAGCVVHLAGRAHRPGTPADYEADVQATRALTALAARAELPRFIHMSSIGVLGTHNTGSAWSEDTAPAPREPYAMAKLQAEQAVQDILGASATSQWVILRPPMVYGPGAPGNFARLLAAVRRGWPLPLASVRNRRSLMGIDNLLSALTACLEHPAAANQMFLVADDECVSTPQLVELMAAGLGVSARLFPVPPTALEVAGRLTGRTRMTDSLLRDLVVDASRLRQRLGWTPVRLAAQGIMQAAATSRT